MLYKVELPVIEFVPLKTLSGGFKALLNKVPFILNSSVAKLESPSQATKPTLELLSSITFKLFRIIDVSMTSGIIGLITMVVNSKTQRLGDISAGTAVITLKNKINISHTILEDIGEEYKPKYPLVIKLSDNDARIIKETYQASLKKADSEILSKLVGKIEQVTGIKNDLDSKKEFVQTILKDYNYYTQNM